MVTAVDWYLLEKEYQSSVAREREFKSLKQVLEGKARLLKQQGKGKPPNQWAMRRKKKQPKRKKSPIFPCLLLTNNHIILFVNLSNTTNCPVRFLLALITDLSQLHSKSCDYLYKLKVFLRHAADDNSKEQPDKCKIAKSYGKN